MMLDYEQKLQVIKEDENAYFHLLMLSSENIDKSFSTLVDWVYYLHFEQYQDEEE